MINIAIPAPIHKALLHLPPDYGVLVLLKGLEPAAFAVRVEQPQAFEHKKLDVRLTITTWRSSQGTWVVVVPMRFSHILKDKGEAFLCLNPRQVADYEVLQKLATQQTFLCLFLSMDVRRCVYQEFAWP